MSLTQAQSHASSLKENVNSGGGGQRSPSSAHEIHDDDGRTQKDLSHEFHSSPHHHSLTTEAPRPTRQLTVVSTAGKAKTWDGGETQHTNPPSSQEYPTEEPTQLVNMQQLSGGQQDEDSAPKDDGLTVESQVEMNRDRDRITLWQSKAKRVRMNFNVISDDVDLISNSNSQNSVPTQNKLDDTQHADAISQPTQLISQELAANNMDFSDMQKALLVNEQKKRSRYVHEALSSPPGADGSQNYFPQTQLVNDHSSEPDYSNPFDRSDVPTQAVIDEDGVSSPQLSQMDDVVVSSSREEEEGNDGMNFEAPTQLVSDSVVQVSSTPVATALTARRRRTIAQENKGTPSSLEVIASSDEEGEISRTQPVAGSNEGVANDTMPKPTSFPLSAINGKKRLFDAITPARPMQFEVRNSTPSQIILHAGTVEQRRAKRSKLAAETPVARRATNNSSDEADVPDHTPHESQGERLQVTENDKVPEESSSTFALGQCAWVHWTGDKYYPVRTVPKSSVARRLFQDDESQNLDARTEIVFGDGRDGEAAVSHFFPLELTKGDVVKFEDEKKGNYIVEELSYEPSFGEIKTVNGYNCVVIKTKAGKTARAPVWKLYMIRKIWTEYLAKREKLKNTFIPDVSSAFSPRRNKASICYDENSDTKITSSSSAASILAAQRGNSQGLFRSCVFAVTLEQMNDQKLVASIVHEGGVVLMGSFRELFDVADGTAKLLPQFHDMKFVAVIANTHRKTPKYLEALAFGWPCLSYHFIEDCISSGALLDTWPSYILAAGHSEQLNSTLSLDFSSFKTIWQAGGNLLEIVSARHLPLQRVDCIYLLASSGGGGGGGALTAAPASRFSSSTTTQSGRFKDDSPVEQFRFFLHVMGCRNIFTVHSIKDAPAHSIVFDYRDSKASRGRVGKLAPWMSMDQLELSRMLKGHPLTKQTVYPREWLTQSIINGRIL